MTVVTRRGRAVLTILTMVCLSTVFLFTVAADAQAGGHSEITIDIDLDTKEVIVTEVLRPRRSGDQVVAFLPPEASRIAFDGTILGTTIFDTYKEVVLSGGSGAELSYVLTSTTGRAAEGTRVTTAMVGFHLYPSLDTAEVRVRLPQGFTANMGPAFIPQLVADETLEYVLGSIDAESLWGLWFVALKDSALERQTVMFDNADIEIAAWADDPEWMDFAVEYVSAGIPLLEEQTGYLWPQGDMEVVESVAPDQAGYGGWFDWREDRIEITDSLSSEVFLHELAHAWFNDLIFEERWMVEGFAEEYASSVGEVYGNPVLQAVEPGPRPEGFEGLNEWRSMLWFEDSWDAEVYGYSAAYWVVQELRADIGDEGMANVLAAMFERRHPYELGEERRRVGTNDWRRFYDLIEAEGGSATSEQLFRDYVITDAQARLLEAREIAKGRYTELQSASELEVPESIRVEMAAWRFGDAVRGIDAAQKTLAELADLGSRAEALGLTMPAHLADFYLRSDSDFTLVREAIAEADLILEGLEDDPDAVDDVTAKNFVLGRFDDIKVTAGGPRLNETVDSGFSFRPYLIALGVLTIVLLVVTIIWVEIVKRGPAELEDDKAGDDEEQQRESPEPEEAQAMYHPPQQYESQVAYSAPQPYGSYQRYETHQAIASSQLYETQGRAEIPQPAGNSELYKTQEIYQDQPEHEIYETHWADEDEPIDEPHHDDKYEDEPEERDLNVPKPSFNRKEYYDELYKVTWIEDEEAEADAKRSWTSIFRR